MGNRVTFTAEYLNNGYLSIPKEIANTLALRSGKKVRVVIEGTMFDKNAFLKLFGIWENKSEDILAAQEFAADYLEQEEIIFASGSKL